MVEPTRRTLLAASAWTAPAIVVASAAPAFAASTPPTNPRMFKYGNIDGRFAGPQYFVQMVEFDQVGGTGFPAGSQVTFTTLSAAPGPAGEPTTGDGQIAGISATGVADDQGVVIGVPSGTPAGYLHWTEAPNPTIAVVATTIELTDGSTQNLAVPLQLR